VKDGKKLRSRTLLECPTAQVWVFTSGNNSTHIAINGSLFGLPIVNQHNSDVFRHLAYLLCEGLRFGIEGNTREMNSGELKQNLSVAYPEVTLTDHPESEHEFKWDAQTAESALENCDQNIYHTNALIRQPWSWHEKGGNRKALIDLSGDFKYEPRLLEVKDQKPHLLWLWQKAWDRLKESNSKSRKKLDIDVDTQYLISELSKKFPDIVHDKPNHSGWYGPYTHYAYADTQASVYIQEETGFVKDFGSERFSMTFEDYLLDIR